ncbi:MAG TPA: enoyl-CoA hydratase-related protein, partial [Waddliaceae bacterium]
MNPAFHFSLDDNGIGTLVFDLPDEKVNKISISVLEELESIIDRLAQEPNIKALVLTSGKEGVFVAGADLRSFEPLFKDRSAAEKLIGMGHRVFDKLSQLPFPTVAAIDGACLGGGLELALACTYRVVSDHPKTSLGLPEVSLGIFPGWGGTQRLPRLVGLMQGLKMVVSGKPVTAIQAWKIKLADAIFPAGFFYQKVQEFLNHCVFQQGIEEVINRRKQQGLTLWLVEKNFVGRSLVYWQTEREIINKTKGHYPAPLAALRLIKNTYTKPLSEGLTQEAETFVES